MSFQKSSLAMCNQTIKLHCTNRKEMWPKKQCRMSRDHTIVGKAGEVKAQRALNRRVMNDGPLWWADRVLPGKSECSLWTQIWNSPSRRRCEASGRLESWRPATRSWCGALFTSRERESADNMHPALFWQSGLQRDEEPTAHFHWTNLPGATVSLSYKERTVGNRAPTLSSWQ